VRINNLPLLKQISKINVIARSLSTLFFMDKRLAMTGEEMRFSIIK